MTPIYWTPTYSQAGTRDSYKSQKESCDIQTSVFFESLQISLVEILVCITTNGSTSESLRMVDSIWLLKQTIENLQWQKWGPPLGSSKLLFCKV